MKKLKVKRKKYHKQFKVTIALNNNMIYFKTSGKYERQTPLWAAFCGLYRICGTFVAYPCVLFNARIGYAAWSKHIAKLDNGHFDFFMARVDYRLLEVRPKRNAGRKDILGGFSSHFEPDYHAMGCDLCVHYVVHNDLWIPYLVISGTFRDSVSLVAKTLQKFLNKIVATVFAFVIFSVPF